MFIPLAYQFPFFSFFFPLSLTMKFLEVDSLDLINTAFLWETSDCILTGRVEAYSCKFFLI